MSNVTESASGATAPVADELKKLSQIQTKWTKVRLSEIDTKADKYCHRDPDALKEEALRPLMDSLVMEGLQVPIEVYRDRNKFTIVNGRARVEACGFLVAKNTPNFTADMELDAIELKNFTPQDLMVRSISDNEVRLNFDRKGRIVAAAKLYKEGVQVSRAAAALRISVKTYQRDLLIAKYPWMYDLFVEGSIDASSAIDLLEAAEKVDRVDLLKDDLDEWITSKKGDIKMDDIFRSMDGDELPAVEKLVKRYMPRHLVDHWVELILEKQRFDGNAEWEYSARIDKKKRVLHIPAVTLDLDNDPPEMIAKTVSKCSAISKQAIPYLQQRLAQTQGSNGNGECPYDLDYLKEVGATDLIERLEERQQRGKALKAKERGTIAADHKPIALDTGTIGDSREEVRPTKKT